MAAIEAIRASTFKPGTIQKGWKESGLWPLNWRKISSKIEQLNAQDPTSDTTPEATPEPTTPEIQTPQTIRTLQRNVDFCIEDGIPDTVRKTLVGALRMSVAGDQAIAELTTMTSIAQSRRLRQARDRRHVDSSMGVIYSHQVRSAKQGRLQGETRDLLTKNKALKGMPVGAKKRHCKAYKPVHNQLNLVWASMRSAGLLDY